MLRMTGTAEMEGKLVGDIEQTERGVAWTDPEGQRHDYERSMRTLCLRIQELASIFSLNQFQDDAPFDRPLSPELRGNALIEDRSLSVIGRPETISRAIDVSFVALDETRLARIREGIKPVQLSYMESEWEFGNDAGWWTQIALPVSQFQLLAEAYESGKLTKVSIGLDMEHMFLDQGYYVPRDKLDWFVEPTKSGARMVNGQVAVLTIETAPINLRPPEPREPKIDVADDIADYKPKPQDSVAPALNNLANKIEGVQKALHWIFWVLVVLLFVVGSSHK
jgi:hypothetical protein